MHVVKLAVLAFLQEDRMVREVGLRLVIIAFVRALRNVNQAMRAGIGSQCDRAMVKWFVSRVHPEREQTGDKAPRI
jgi:hypothetical protein